MNKSQRHNEISREMLMRLFKPVMQGGGNTSELMVILESVVAGVLTICAEIDGTDAAHRDGMLIGLEAGVRERLAEMPVERRK